MCDEVVYLAPAGSPVLVVTAQVSPKLPNISNSKGSFLASKREADGFRCWRASGLIHDAHPVGHPGLTQSGQLSSSDHNGPEVPLMQHVPNTKC